MAVLLIALSVLAFVFAGRMRRGGRRLHSRLLLGLAVFLALLALVAAFNTAARRDARQTPAATDAPR